MKLYGGVEAFLHHITKRKWYSGRPVSDVVCYVYLLGCTFTVCHWNSTPFPILSHRWIMQPNSVGFRHQVCPYFGWHVYVVYNLKLSRRLNSINHIFSIKQLLDDEKIDGSRNSGLLTVQPPDRLLVRGRFIDVCVNWFLKLAFRLFRLSWKFTSITSSDVRVAVYTAWNYKSLMNMLLVRSWASVVVRIPTVHFFFGFILIFSVPSV